MCDYCNKKWFYIYLNVITKVNKHEKKSICFRIQSLSERVIS